ncbi:unnamed protein product [Leptidea sinapis]|uniref:Spaetzle domain-containing protein n=1 Tax=Leptidea sinapis TaxID=189913 RepID=A0A5E4QK83_9NEOP|nr:unnamed protein product [Leptidea sinapis]
MACFYYIWIALIVHHTRSYADSEWRNERSTHHENNGSYKILNRFVKPFTNRRVMDSSIVFPDLSARSGNDLALQIPDECKRVGICEDLPDYPVDVVTEVLHRDWFIIVNEEKRPRQTFRVEICRGGENSACSPIAYFQKGYQASCVQKYVLRTMVALNEKNQVIERPFQVPSCCSCVAKVV